MDKIKIVVTATNAVCVGSPVPLTTGMVGLLAEFTFSSEWDNLTKTAVCVGSGTTKDVLDVKDEIIVPHECLKDTAGHLKIGVYGVNSSGDLVIPTVYAYCGRLLQGAEPSGDTSADPTLPIWAQLQAMMGDLSSLTTTAKENLVAAINEAAKSGGAAADVRMQVAGGYIQYSSDGGANWNNLIAVAELIGPTDETLTKSGQAADSAVVGNRFSALSEEIVTTSESKVAAHNTGTDTHSDIRVLIQGLTDRLNALADSDDTTLDQMSEVVAYIKSNKSLIDAITTSKVNVSDIVNNLATDISNKPLSAAQGVALKELINALSNSMTAYRTAAEQDVIDSGKVDKATGKGLSSNDYTDAAKAKVDALAPVATSGSYDDLTNKPTIPTAYDDTEVRHRIGAIEAKESTWDAKSNFSGSYNDLTDKPAIPDAVTEGTVSGWGFTKNTGTYSKPTGGIPKTDLAAAVQASLGKADTALQEHQSLAAYRTAAAQDIIDNGKQDKITSTNKLAYSLISGTPTIPTVPTNVSAFTNDAGYLTLATLPKYEGVVE